MQSAYSTLTNVSKHDEAIFKQAPLQSLLTDVQ